MYRGNWAEASERLHATDNFPDFTGRSCPAPCETSCVLGINAEPVTIKQIDCENVERAWAEGWLEPIRPAQRTGRRAAVVGSGPAGLTAAQQLARAGHSVVVFERAPRTGGLLRYGIPGLELEKRAVDPPRPAHGRRGRAALRRHGRHRRSRHSFSVAGGNEIVDVVTVRSGFDAVLIATGATVPRELQVPGRKLSGVHRLGTAHRQGARSVHQPEILPEPPTVRSEKDPWLTWPRILRTYPAHQEGRERLFSVSTAVLVGDAAGQVRALRADQVRPGTEASGRATFEPVAGSTVELRCDLVLLALGFAGPERQGLVAEVGLALTERGTVAVDAGWQTGAEGVFACGDALKGQSLVVWAIAEGRATDAAVDRHLMGTSDLPAPVAPGQLPLR